MEYLYVLLLSLHIAQTMGGTDKQTLVDRLAKLEKKTDMYISSLRRFIEAMGGRLEIKAHFPEGDVKINQFEELEEEQLPVV